MPLPPPPLPNGLVPVFVDAFERGETETIGYAPEPKFVPLPCPPPSIQPLVAPPWNPSLQITPEFEASHARVQAMVAKRNPGKFARAKGQRGEREIVKLLQMVVDKVSHELGIDPPLIQRNQLQSHVGGHDLHGLVGYAIEVKNCEHEQISTWWKQTLRQRKEGEVAILLYTSNKKPWKCRMRGYVASAAYYQDHNHWTTVEMDFNCDFEDFLSWFENSYRDQLTPG